MKHEFRDEEKQNGLYSRGTGIRSRTKTAIKKYVKCQGINRG